MYVLLLTFDVCWQLSHDSPAWEGGIVQRDPDCVKPCSLHLMWQFWSWWYKDKTIIQYMPSGERGKEGEELKATGISNIIIADDFREKGKEDLKHSWLKLSFYNFILEPDITDFSWNVKICHKHIVCWWNFNSTTTKGFCCEGGKPFSNKWGWGTLHLANNDTHLSTEIMFDAVFRINDNIYI